MASADRDKCLASLQKLISRGQPEKASRDYDAFVERNPNDANFLLKSAEIFERAGYQDRAAASYCRLAQSFSEAGFYPKAIAVLKRVLSLQPDAREVHLDLADLNEKLGHVSESVRHYQKAAGLDERSGDKRQSIDILKKIADLGPPDVEKRLEVASLYYREGYDDSGYGQFCHAVSEVEPGSLELLEITQRMCKAAPRDQRLKLKLAEVYLERQEPKLALEVLEGAAQQGRTGRTVELLGEAKVQADEATEAKALFEEAVELYKSEWDHGRRREVVARLREFDSAAEEAAVAPQSRGVSTAAPGAPAPVASPAPAPPEPTRHAEVTGPLPSMPIEVSLREQENYEPETRSGPGASVRRSGDMGTSSESSQSDRVSEDRKLDQRLGQADVLFRKGETHLAVAELEQLAQNYPHRTDPLFRLLWIHERLEDFAGLAQVRRRLARVMEERGDHARSARFTADAHAADLTAEEAGQAQPPEAAPASASPVAAQPSPVGRAVRTTVTVPLDSQESGRAIRGPDGARESAAASQQIESELRRVVESGGDPAERQAMQKTVLSTAFRHALTGLPIRALFMERVDQALGRARRDSNYIFAVLMLDLDRFKMVNDSMGHEAGDQLLVSVARRLEEHVREGNSAAYLGGDEFTILLDDISDAKVATRVAEQIGNRLALAFNLDGKEVFTTASIGIALGSADYAKPEDLIRDADTAMYRAKAHGKARYELFDSAMHTRAIALLELETDLRRAVERGDFQIHYQPIVDLKTGKIAGFEALARWLHPDGHLVPPMDFIPMAEEISLIVPIDRWVLREACHQIQSWQLRYEFDPPLTINVNLSGKHFAKPDLTDFIKSVLADTAIDPRTLLLEITESVVMDNIQTAQLIVSQLKKLNIGVVVDDFGTGHSSLAALHRFPFETLKIDRAFVHGMKETLANEEIVKTIIALARNLRMTVVAEGIETPTQLARLRELGCEFGQGHLMSKAVNHEAANMLLHRNPTW